MGSDIQLVTVGTVEVGQPSNWFPLDSASGGMAICSQGSPTWFPMESAVGAVNHYDSTMRETEGADLGPPNLASGGRHHAEV